MTMFTRWEAVVAAAIVLAASSMLVTDSPQLADAQPVVSSDSSTIAVVVMRARRMNAEQKLNSVQLESATAGDRV